MLVTHLKGRERGLRPTGGLEDLEMAAVLSHGEVCVCVLFCALPGLCLVWVWVVGDGLWVALRTLSGPRTGMGSFPVPSLGGGAGLGARCGERACAVFCLLAWGPAYACGVPLA